MALILAKEVLGGHDEEAASKTTILEQSQSAGRLRHGGRDETRRDETGLLGIRRLLNRESCSLWSY